MQTSTLLSALPSSRLLSTALLSAGLGALSLLAPLGAAATAPPGQITINFDALTPPPGPPIKSISNPYAQDGFTFANPSGLNVVSGNSSPGDGETSLYGNTGSASTTLTQSNGGTFDFNAIDLGPFGGQSGGFAVVGPVLFTGTFAKGGTPITSTVKITSTTHQQFFFSGFTGLSSLTFAGQLNGNGPTGTSYPEFDNVVVVPGNAPAGVAPVPEASTTVSLGLLLAFGGLALAARRKKAQAAA